jgi:ribose 5-phosphate isomerase A
MSDADTLKIAAAGRALELVMPGMKLGLGSGSTSAAFVELLGERVRGGLKVICTATSEAIHEQARGLGIALAPLEELAPLDLAVDGADEADADLNLIKGGGGAHTREKIVAASAKKFVVIADGSKWVDRLGRFPLPVEAVPFAHQTTRARLQAAATALGYGKIPMTMRMKGAAPFVTDNGNLIYDCRFGAITDCAKLAAALSQVTGVVEHGLFVGMANRLILARVGGIEVIEPRTPPRH